MIFGAENQEYKGKDLVEVHKNLGITDQHFDSFKAHLVCILKDLKSEEEIIQEVMQSIEKERSKIV